MGALFRHTVHGGRLKEIRRILPEAQEVVAMVIAENKNDVSLLFLI